MRRAPMAGGGDSVVLVIMLVLLLVLVPVGCAKHNMSCSFEPQESPTRVDCDFEGREEVIITHNYLPESARQVRIFNADRIEVRENALSVLNSPESIHFEDIKSLEIKRNDPKTGFRDQQLNIILDRIGSLRLDTGSFSSWKESVLDISITNINECLIYGGAIVSSLPSTSVTLENITNGTFYPGTFATTLGRLTLRNVGMPLPCQNNTFAGRIGKLSLTAVNLKSVTEGCFTANKTWDSLEILSSRLGDISERGFQGRIEDFLIEGSEFGRIYPNAFDLGVTNFSISESSVQVLQEHALNVRADGGITIQRCTVDDPHGGAFDRLNSSKSIRGIQLSQLSFRRISNGFLRVPDAKSLTLRDLNIPIPCECRIRERVSQLFSTSDDLPEQKVRLFQQAYKNIRCIHDNGTLSLGEYHCSNCDPPMESICDVGDRNTGADQASPAPAVPFWIPLVASFGFMLLLGAIIFIFVVRHRRLSADRPRDTHVKHSSSGRITGEPQHFPWGHTQDGHQPDFSRWIAEGNMPQKGSGSTRVDTRVELSPVYASASDATGYLGIYEDIPGETNGEDLYEEIPTFEQMAGVGATAKHEPSNAHPLYAEVNEDNAENAACSEIFAHADASGRPPVNAQANKNKNTTSQLSKDATCRAEDTSKSEKDAVAMSGPSHTSDAVSDLPVYAQVIKKGSGGKDCEGHQTRLSDISEACPDDSMAPDFPVYSQVIKGRPDGKEQDVTEKHPDFSEACPDDGHMTSDLPVYAKVKKTNPDAKKLNQSREHLQREASPESPVYAETEKFEGARMSHENHRDPSQQTCRTSDGPLYEEIPGLATVEDASSGSRLQIVPRLCDPALPIRPPELTERSAAALSSDNSPVIQQESSLHTVNVHSPMGLGGAEDGEGLGVDLQYNALYGTIMSSD